MALLFWIINLLLIWTNMQYSDALKNVKAAVPIAAKVNDSLILRCDYDLENKELYTVKWYKGINEFFRYTPKEKISMQIFTVPGLLVDLSRSSANEVTLLEVQKEASGRYKCEVTIDQPYFFTIFSSGYLNVVELPRDDPIMEIFIDTTRNGGIIKANCTTPPSYPAMNVTWYINGIKVDENSKRLINLDPTYAFSPNKNKTPLMTVSQLAKEIDENIFHAGVIKVQCVSTLFDLYRSENVRSIEDQRFFQPWPSSVISFAKEPSLEIYLIYFLSSLHCVLILK